ncbi:MAG: HAD-IIA family hydrolase [Candidatus Lokiarchaeota archaeon]|nr:HAD-IIA family hydrolase [Candidatus Lokiarchaeota archaeon]
MRDESSIKAILIDIAGTLVYGGKPISGSIGVIKHLRTLGLKLIFATNTDSQTPTTIHRELVDLGFEILREEIFTPIIALKEFLERHRNKKIFFLLSKQTRMEFEDYLEPVGDEIPHFVVLGDFRDDWRLERLDKAFQYVINGAQLLGTQGNRYFIDNNKNLLLDTGSFVQTLAYAANVTPRIFGKPNLKFFEMALRRIGTTSSETLIIGDDIEADIKGGKEAGLHTILVRTGKGASYQSSIEMYSDTILDSIADLPLVLEKSRT